MGIDSTPKEKETQLLSSRVINSIPIVRSLWGYGVDRYNYAKNTALLKPGINAAETLMQPFIQTYISIDGFASNQVDKVTSAYSKTTTSLVQAAVYPVGYVYGMTLGTMNAVENGLQGTRLEKPVEKLYDVVDSVIDGVMPAQEGEKADEERSSSSSSALRRKNPVRRLQKRIGFQSLRALPANSFKYAVQTIKKYTFLVAARSVDFSVSFTWGRLTSAVQRVQRISNFVLGFTFIRNLLELPLPFIYSLAEQYDLGKRLKHDGGPLFVFLLGLALEQLDGLHSIVGDMFPRTSEIIEQLSLTVYNIQQFLEHHSKKRRISVFEDEERLSKREKRSPTETTTPPPPSSSSSSASSSSSSTSFSSSSSSSSSSVGKENLAIEKLRENPFAALLVDTEMDDTIAGVEPLSSYRQANSSKNVAKKEEKAEEEEEEKGEEEEEGKEEETDADFNARVAERAKQEMQKWKDQEIQAREERKRHLRERHIRQRELRQEQEKKLEEDKLRKAAEKRAELAEEAKKDQERRENEILEKEIAHYKAHKKFLEEQEARDAKLREKHEQEAYEKKRAEVERVVKAELKKREEEWRAEHADEIRAKEIGKELIEEEEREKREAGAAQEAEEEEKQEEPIQESTPEEAKSSESTEKVEEEKKEEVNVEEKEKEVIVIGGMKIVDEVTHWTVATENDEPWQTISNSKPAHITAATEAILHPKPIVDANNGSLEKNNEFLALAKNSQGTATI